MDSSGNIRLKESLPGLIILGNVNCKRWYGLATDLSFHIEMISGDINDILFIKDRLKFILQKVSISYPCTKSHNCTHVPKDSVFNILCHLTYKLITYYQV